MRLVIAPNAFRAGEAANCEAAGLKSSTDKPRLVLASPPTLILKIVFDEMLVLFPRLFFKNGFLKACWRDANTSVVYIPVIGDIQPCILMANKTQRAGTALK